MGDSEPLTADVLSIGVFSRASSISVRTLRNYHDSGLLVPAVVDRSSGYRYYGADQLADALVIVRLRSLDVPLVDVHRILTARDPALTSEVLDRHRDTMQTRLAETERIVAILQSGLPTTATPVHLVDDAAMQIIQITDDIPVDAMWTWLERSIKTLADIAATHTAPAGPPGALYGPDLLDEAHERVTAFVPIATSFLVPVDAAGVTIGEMPATRWAVLAHTDGFGTIGETYRLLGAWVARHTHPVEDQPVCERYLDIHSGGADLNIEIRWPIRR